jgi:hypothetical protein
LLEEVATDGLGNTLEPGDVIAYGTTVCDRKYLTLGVIWKTTRHEDYRGRVHWHLGVYRRRAGAARYDAISKATITMPQAVVKLHPDHYDEIVADLIAAKAADGA